MGVVNTPVDDTQERGVGDTDSVFKCVDDPSSTGNISGFREVEESPETRGTCPPAR